MARRMTKPGKGCIKLSAILTVVIIAHAPAGSEPSRLDVMKSRDLVNKGNVHLGRREFDQALETYTEALMLDPGNQAARDNIVLTHNNWGIINFQQKKYKEARSEWEQALKLNPMDASVRRNLQILKMTLAKMGLTGEGETPPIPAKSPPRTESEDNSTSGIVILTPGLKQSQASKKPAEQPVSTTSGGMATYSTSAVPDEKFTDNNPPQKAPATTPNSTNSNAPSPQSGNIESRLASIEMKIYGRKQEELPVLKRLEKLEIDTNGQVKSGTIQDRIEALRQNYGL